MEEKLYSLLKIEPKDEREDEINHLLAENIIEELRDEKYKKPTIKRAFKFCFICFACWVIFAGAILHEGIIYAAFAPLPLILFAVMVSSWYIAEQIDKDGYFLRKRKRAEKTDALLHSDWELKRREKIYALASFLLNFVFFAFFLWCLWCDERSSAWIAVIIGAPCYNLFALFTVYGFFHYDRRNFGDAATDKEMTKAMSNAKVFYILFLVLFAIINVLELI